MIGSMRTRPNAETRGHCADKLFCMGSEGREIIMSMRTSQKRTSQPCRNFYATHGFREAIEEMEIPDFKTYARAIEATHGALTIGEEKRFNVPH